MAEGAADWRRLKEEIRIRARAARDEQADQDRLSQLILGQVTALPAYAAARTLMVYVDFGSEVRTRPLFPLAWDQGKQIVVPYCRPGGSLGLFRLESFDELAPGTLGILEPKPELRGLPGRRAELAELDLIVVPGLAFDRRGGRIGYGKGYYDNLLRDARRGTTLVAPAFECQLVPRIPVQPHDVPMDLVVTQRAVYEGKRGPVT